MKEKMGSRREDEEEEEEEEEEEKIRNNNNKKMNIKKMMYRNNKNRKKRDKENILSKIWILKKGLGREKGENPLKLQGHVIFWVS